MLCALRDLDKDDSSTISSAGNIYRPLYFLSGYGEQSKRWVRDYPRTSLKPQKLSLDLSAASGTSWKSLGFPSSSSESLPDGAAASPVPQLQGARITLSFTGIASFDVFRGLWLVHNAAT